MGQALKNIAILADNQVLAAPLSLALRSRSFARFVTVERSAGNEWSVVGQQRFHLVLALSFSSDTERLYELDRAAACFAESLGCKHVLLRRLADGVSKEGEPWFRTVEDLVWIVRDLLREKPGPKPKKEAA